MNPLVRPLLENLSRVIVGKDHVLRMVVTCVLARGHLLLEDVPGVGKTILARALACSLRTRFGRIQFTPDLLPSDITGVSIFHPSKREFEFHRGPVFANVLLADEINRASPRTQSSLLECMEEQQVTVDGTTYPLEKLFVVIATQNPIELDGTYPLPEAQLDRFLMRLDLGYPRPAEEMKILLDQVRRHPIEDLETVLSTDELCDLQTQTREVHVGEEIRQYIVDLLNRTRDLPEVQLGISPRGGLALMRASQAHAFLHGENFVTPDTVKAVASAVLSHRLILDPHQEHSGLRKKDVVDKVLESTPVPTTPHERPAPAI